MIDTTLVEYKRYLPPPIRDLPWRTHPLDGKLLLFERHTGLNVLLEGEETRHFQRIAPRTLLIAVTNICNLTCPFCYRDLESRSLWRYQTLMEFCQAADRWGVLEVAFGGGEPILFPHWTEFISELHDTTSLCLNFTTNGTLINDDFLRQIAGKYGQIRVSLYEDNHWAQTAALLAQCQARFGVNWLITPAELGNIDNKFGQLLSLGVRDFLFLSYKGNDLSMHLNSAERQKFATFINGIYLKLGTTVQIKLDICWGNSLPEVPRLFNQTDCGAGDEFLSVTSDKHIKVCSFQQTTSGIPFKTLDDVRRLWETRRSAKQAALIEGCARLPNSGMREGDGNGAYIDLAAIQ